MREGTKVETLAEAGSCSHSGASGRTPQKSPPVKAGYKSGWACPRGNRTTPQYLSREDGSSRGRGGASTGPSVTSFAATQRGSRLARWVRFECPPCLLSSKYSALIGHLFGPFRSIGSQPRCASDYPAQLFCFESNCRQVEGDVANSC